MTAAHPAIATIGIFVAIVERIVIEAQADFHALPRQQVPAIKTKPILAALVWAFFPVGVGGEIVVWDKLKKAWYFNQIVEAQINLGGFACVDAVDLTVIAVSGEVPIGMKADVPVTHIQVTNGGHVLVTDYALIVMFVDQLRAEAQIKLIGFSVDKLQISLDR